MRDDADKRPVIQWPPACPGDPSGHLPAVEALLKRLTIAELNWLKVYGVSHEQFGRLKGAPVADVWPPPGESGARK